VPTYDYECDDCKRVYEVQQRISAEPLTVCQYCGGRIRRLLSAAPFILKGGGWYVTDYPSESRKKAMEAEKKSSDGGAATKPADGGAAAKPADGGAAAKPADGAGSSSTSTTSTSTTTSTSESSPAKS
jgi:putative FmdB family regulatory protein